MFSFAADYFIMVFVASLGVMQAAASVGGLRGLLVFKHPIAARTLGVALAVAAVTWFFLSAERNINDYKGGLDSNQQGLLFFLAVAASGLLTCLLTSLLNARMGRDGGGAYADSAYENGVDAADGGAAVVGGSAAVGGGDIAGGDIAGDDVAGDDVAGVCGDADGSDADANGSDADAGEWTPDAGLGALRGGNWWQAVGRSYRYWFGEARCWRTQIKRYFFG